MLPIVFAAIRKIFRAHLAYTTYSAILREEPTIESDSRLRQQAENANKNARSEISTLWVDVSPSCFEVKAVFPTYPTEDVIREIKDFSLETGRPYEWRGHSHTPPPKDGKPPVYVGRIEISAVARKRKEFSPCPCCTPNHRKFGEGLIAWFEDEKVIRLMGNDCFAAINRSGHEEAYQDLVRRENERRVLDHVLRQIGRMPNWIRTGEELLPIARAADDFFPQIENRITKSQGVSNFWREIRGGMLHLNEIVAKVNVRRDGSEGEVEVGKETFETIPVATFPIMGCAAMNPARKALHTPISEAVAALRSITPTTEDAIRALNPIQRLAVSRDLKRILDLLKRKREDLHDQVQFLAQLNIKRLSQWAADAKSPVDFTIFRNEGKLIIGGRRQDYVFDIPEELRISVIPVIDDP